VNEAAMSLTPTTKHLLIQAFIAGLICIGLMALVGALAINPGVGEGFGIPEASFRYHLGVWIESYSSVVAIIACWPLMLVDSLGWHPKSPLPWIAGMFIAGTGWVLLWHFASHQLRHIRRVHRP
jgi:hypothetical protein